MILDIASPYSLSSYGFGDAARHIRERAGDAYRRLAEARLIADIQRVSRREENWDGWGSARPDPAACSRAAAESTEYIHAAFAADLGWQHPLVGSNEYGEISFEWWRGAKRLTIYVGSDEVRYVCSWGADINQHMDADLLAPNGFSQKWRWFRA